ncbi:MAG: ssuA [Rhizobacter sp.]|nr:ssuA [Rhizobacter sp.]
MPSSSTFSRWLRIAGIRALAAGVLLAAGAAAHADEPPPKVIRFGLSSPGTGFPPRISFTSVMAILGERKVLEEEFKKDGIKVEWVFFKGSGPAANEAMANRALDFSTVGDLPAVIGRSVGIPTRAILPTGSRTNTYVAVPANSPINSVAQLRGKRVAIAKGSAGQLSANRILAANGLTENDVKLINLDSGASQAAFAAGELDAVFGSLTLLRDRDKQHNVKIIYSTRNVDPLSTYQQYVVVYEPFAKKHPEIVKRVVTAIVRAAQWGSDEHHRDEVLNLWGDVGSVPVALHREELAGVPIAQRMSPLFDDFVRAKTRLTIADAQRFGLVRKPFDPNAWIDDSYLNAALKELGLEHFWPRHDAKGALLDGGDAYAAAVKFDPSLAAVATPARLAK